MQNNFVKKALVLVLGLSLMLGVVGCSKEKADASAVDITVEQLIDQVYENTDASMYNQTVQTESIDLTDKDSMNYYLGVDDLSGLESAAYSEPMMSSVAHSVVALKFDNAEDAKAAAASLKESAPVQKWVCVEPDAVTAKVVYNTYVIFSMSSADFIDNLNNMTFE